MKSLLPCRQDPQVPSPNATDFLRHLPGKVAAASESPNPSWRQLGQAFVRLGKGRALAQRLWISVNSSLQPGVRFYLTVLLTLAAANSLFILVGTSGTALQCSDSWFLHCTIDYRHSWSIARKDEHNILYTESLMLCLCWTSIRQHKRKLTGLCAAVEGLLLRQGRPGCGAGDARGAPAGSRASAAVLLQQDPAGARPEQVCFSPSCFMYSAAQELSCTIPIRCGIKCGFCRCIVLTQSPL